MATLYPLFTALALLSVTCTSGWFAAGAAIDNELQEGAGNNTKITKMCVTEADCFVTPSVKSNASYTEPKSGVSCVDGTCICDSPNEVYATVRISSGSATVGWPAFFGYTISDDNVTVCAPKAGQACGGGKGYCAPGSYCVFRNLTSNEGKCRCNPGTVLSPAGICECAEKEWSLDENGVCVGKGLGGRCSESRECGYEPVSLSPLECIDGVCSCNSDIFVEAHEVRSSDTTVDIEQPEFEGFFSTKSRTSCLPKPHQACVGLGYCAPGSYCVSNDEMSWKGICKCNPGSAYSVYSGMCECKKRRALNKDGVCPGAGVFEKCDSDGICGIDRLSAQKLLCINGACGCNPVSHEYASVKFEHYVAADENDPAYPGYNVTKISVEACAPKARQPCRQNLCAPLSYCVHKESLKSGTRERKCTCIPNSKYSKESRHCKCKPGYTFHKFRNVCEQYGSQDGSLEIGEELEDDEAQVGRGDARRGSNRFPRLETGDDERGGNRNGVLQPQEAEGATIKKPTSTAAVCKNPNKNYEVRLIGVIAILATVLGCVLVGVIVVFVKKFLETPMETSFGI